MEYCQQNKGLELFAWCLMSNHIHLIAKAEEGYLLQDILRDFKKFTSKKMIKTILENPQESRKEWMIDIFSKAGKLKSNNSHYQFWRQDNKPIEIYSTAVIEQKLLYLHNNLVEEGIVIHPQDYLYSSAMDYYSTEKGLLNVEIL